MVPLERLTSKSISLRFLKNYTPDLYEIQNTYSYRHKAGLIEIWRRSDEKCISENFLKKCVFCNFVILRARTVKLSGYVIIEAYISYLSKNWQFQISCGSFEWLKVLKLWNASGICQPNEKSSVLPDMSSCPPLTCSNSHCSYNSIIVHEIIMMSFWPLEHIPDIYIW